MHPQRHRCALPLPTSSTALHSLSVPLPFALCARLQAPATASHVRATAEVQQQFKELTLSPAQREGKEPVFEGRVTGAPSVAWCRGIIYRLCRAQ